MTDVAAQIKDILEKFTDEESDKVEDIVGGIAKEAASKLKDSSRKKTGKYTRGWTADSKRKGFVFESVVYNKTEPQLTHLLENGHIVANQFGAYGRVNGDGNIAKVEEWAEAELLRKLKGGL